MVELADDRQLRGMKMIGERLQSFSIASTAAMDEAKQRVSSLIRRLTIAMAMLCTISIAGLAFIITASGHWTPAQPVATPTTAVSPASQKEPAALTASEAQNYKRLHALNEFSRMLSEAELDQMAEPDVIVVLRKVLRLGPGGRAAAAALDYPAVSGDRLEAVQLLAKLDPSNLNRALFVGRNPAVAAIISAAVDGLSRNDRDFERAIIAVAIQSPAVLVALRRLPATCGIAAPQTCR